MSICKARNMISTGRREMSASSYFSFTKVCYAGRYFAALNSTDRCECPCTFF